VVPNKLKIGTRVRVLAADIIDGVQIPAAAGRIIGFIGESEWIEPEGGCYTVSFDKEYGKVMGTFFADIPVEYLELETNMKAEDYERWNDAPTWKTLPGLVLVQGLLLSVVVTSVFYLRRLFGR
jgi:hypothetical protein